MKTGDPLVSAEPSPAASATSIEDQPGLSEGVITFERESPWFFLARSMPVIIRAGAHSFVLSHGHTLSKTLPHGAVSLSVEFNGMKREVSFAHAPARHSRVKVLVHGSRLDVVVASGSRIIASARSGTAGEATGEAMPVVGIVVALLVLVGFLALLDSDRPGRSSRADRVIDMSRPTTEAERNECAARQGMTPQQLKSIVNLAPQVLPPYVECLNEMRATNPVQRRR